MRNWITPRSHHNTGLLMKVVEREAIDRVRTLHRMHRFLPRSWHEGYKVFETPVNHRAAGTESRSTER